MGAVYVGIGQYNDLIVAEFADIKIIPDSTAESCDHRFDLVI